MKRSAHPLVTHLNYKSDRTWLALGIMATVVSAVLLLTFDGVLATFVWAPVLIFAIALVSEFVDSALGMGYGTILAPVLLMMGYEPLDIVPAILLSEFLTGALAAAGHQMSGNVDMRPGTRAFGVVAVLGACSFFGTIAAALIALSVPKDQLTTLIGVAITAIGAVILFFSHAKFAFSWWKIFILGLVASFNKGLSGGGYGPLITGGEVLSGVEGKSAIAIASIAESLTCIVGIAVYFLSGKDFSKELVIPLLLGALCSVPFSVLTVKVMKTRFLTVIIGTITLVLGILMLTRLG